MQMFQKGSPVARDVSKVILRLSENAELKRLEEKWLTTSQDCFKNVTSSDDMDSLNLRSLWVLFVISGATSTICLLISTIQCLKSNQQHEDLLSAEGNDTSPSDERLWKKAITFAKQIYCKKHNNSRVAHDVTVTDHVGMTEHSQEMASPVPGILMLPSPPTEVHM